MMEMASGVNRYFPRICHNEKYGSAVTKEKIPNYAALRD